MLTSGKHLDWTRPRSWCTVVHNKYKNNTHTGKNQLQQRNDKCQAFWIRNNSSKKNTHNVSNTRSKIHQTHPNTNNIPSEQTMEMEKHRDAKKRNKAKSNTRRTIGLALRINLERLKKSIKSVRTHTKRSKVVWSHVWHQKPNRSSKTKGGDQLWDKWVSLYRHL